MANCKITDLPTNSTASWDGHSQVWVRNDEKTTMSGDIMFTDKNGNDHSIRKMLERIEELEERLFILQEPGAETLENHKMLRETYKKYKFLEGLVKENDDNG